VKFACENGNDLIKMLEKNHNIDIILMDIQMPEMNGIEATEIIKKKYPQIKIMMLTIYDDDDCVLKAIKAGASGYILKETDPRSMYENINELLAGGAPMTPSIALKALKMLRSNDFAIENESLESFNLSNRQLQILEQLSKGLNYNEIAANLFISPSTVRKHIENIYTKLEVHSKVEAIQKAQKHRLL
jgi:DNA-binding NarL/FixJ family response regulator